MFLALEYAHISFSGHIRGKGLFGVVTCGKISHFDLKQRINNSTEIRHNFDNNSKLVVRLGSLFFDTNDSTLGVRRVKIRRY